MAFYDWNRDGNKDVWYKGDARIGYLGNGTGYFVDIQLKYNYMRS